VLKAASPPGSHSPASESHVFRHCLLAKTRIASGAPSRADGRFSLKAFPFDAKYG
jgi:hypothetical protein